MRTSDPIENPRLFGREHDLEIAINLLRLAECRLLTLSGPGGVGKTSLARRIVHHLQGEYEDAICFVPLQAISEVARVVPTILDYLGLHTSDSESPYARVLRYLKHKRLLIILDNFEQLLAASGFLADILRQAPNVKMLVTSREVLNLQEEWVWPMRGIAYPSSDVIEHADSYAAVQMFAARASRANPAFDLARELPYVKDICALVEGFPLAIELAVGWLKALSCAGILEELRRDTDILSTKLRDMPEEHRSIRAVFDRSWALLTESERTGLMLLSLFRGTITRGAAQTVAGVSLHGLASLIDKSLLFHNADGRYQFHELFRQYAYEKLQDSGNLLHEAMRRLGEYYRDFLAARLDDVFGRRQHEAVREVLAELDNIRSFPSQLLFTADTSASRKAIYLLGEVFQFVGYYREGLHFLQQIIAQLEAMGDEPLDSEYRHLLAEMLNGVGWISIRLGNFEAAEQAILRAQAIYDQHHLRPAMRFASDPRIPLAELKGILGESETARLLSEAAYADAMAQGDILNASVARYILTNVCLAHHEFSQAQDYISEAIDLTRQASNDWFLAYCLNQQGHIFLERGDYPRAQHQYEESYRIRERLGEPEGQAVALNHLGMLALIQGDYARAREHFQRSLPIYQRLEDRGGLFAAHIGLGIAHTVSGELGQAYAHLTTAAGIAAEAQVKSWWLDLCAAIGEFFASTGASGRGTELIQLACAHRETRSVTRTRAEQWLRDHGGVHVKQVSLPDLDWAVQQLEVELATHIWDEESHAADRSLPDQAHMVEALTVRELEILRLIAEGMSNQEIADHLVLVLGTVKSHNYSIFGKLGAKNRSQAVRRARELNLL